ncbi:hypothetical protein HK098_004153 [Nowakowskiella sp. JEL0407]|nr:hypothetical protein HK098_004153 [Nowakowskiella sp. JEL0407]
MIANNYSSLLLLSIFLSSSIHAQSCQQYPSIIPSSTNTSGICQGSINYPVFIPSGANISALESTLTQLSQLLPLKSSFPACANAYAAWACVSTFPRCGSNPNIDVPCLSLCQDVLATCTEPFTLLKRQSSLPNCTFVARYGVPYPETQCVDRTSVGNWTFTGTSSKGNTSVPATENIPAALLANGCPAPFMFVKPEDLAKLDDSVKKKCLGPCCIPCPFVNSLYYPGSMQRATDIVSYVRMASIFFIVLILISYMVLPGYQRRPRDLILYSTACLFIWQSTVFFSAGDVRRIQCVDQFTASTQFTNKLCAVQSGLVMFGTYSLILWASALIINLHLTLVWKKNYVDNHIVPIHVFVALVSTAMTAVPLVLGYMKYDFGSVCFISQEHSNTFFFYPLAAIIVPMFILHCVTFVYITQASIRTAATQDLRYDPGASVTSLSTQSLYGASTKGPKRSAVVVNSLRMQWRPMLLALLVLATFTSFWLFHMLRLSELLKIDPTTTVWVQKWVMCLFQTHNSNAELAKAGTSNADLRTPYDTCSDLVLPNIPPFAQVVAVDVIVSTPGFWLLVIFGLRVELVNDWLKFIRGGFCCGARRRKRMERKNKESVSDVRAYALGSTDTLPMKKSSGTFLIPISNDVPGSVTLDGDQNMWAKSGNVRQIQLFIDDELSDGKIMLDTMKKRNHMESFSPYDLQNSNESNKSRRTDSPNSSQYFSTLSTPVRSNAALDNMRTSSNSELTYTDTPKYISPVRPASENMFDQSTITKILQPPKEEIKSNVANLSPYSTDYPKLMRPNFSGNQYSTPSDEILRENAETSNAIYYLFANAIDNVLR